MQNVSESRFPSLSCRRVSERPKDAVHVEESLRPSGILIVYLFIYLFFYAYFVVFKLLHNKTFRWVENPRPYRRSTRPFVKCHGLLRCRSCRRLFCRDNNGSSNIWKILYNAVHDLPRPAYLCRQNPVPP